MNDLEKLVNGLEKSSPNTASEYVRALVKVIVVTAILVALFTQRSHVSLCTPLPVQLF